jgi:hypothetical protein
MTQSTTKSDILHDSDRLYIAMDLGRDSWQLAISDGGKTIREVKVDRRDSDAGKAEFLTEVGKAREKFGLDSEAAVFALYEAGRDGFWIAHSDAPSLLNFPPTSRLRASPDRPERPVPPILPRPQPPSSSRFSSRSAHPPAVLRGRASSNGATRFALGRDLVVRVKNRDIEQRSL